MPVLEEVNPHPKDSLLTFEDEGHRYTYVPLECAIRKSMTGLLKPRFETFDGEAIVHERFAGWLKDDSHKYGPLTQYLTLVKQMDRADAEKEILKLWSAKGDVAAAAGTQMHRDLELYWNDQLPEPTPTTPPPMGCVSFLGLLEWWNPEMELKPWRTEFLCVLTATDDEGIEFPVVAGSIDLIMQDKQGNFWLVCSDTHALAHRLNLMIRPSNAQFDYKRTSPKTRGLLGKRKAEASKFFKVDMAKAPFQDHPADDFTKYSCQLAGYAWILKHGNYNMNVVSTTIVQMHEDLNGKAHAIETADVFEEVDAMMRLEIQIAKRERRLAKAEKEGREPTVEELAPPAVEWRGGYLLDAEF